MKKSATIVSAAVAAVLAAGIGREVAKMLLDTRGSEATSQQFPSKVADELNKTLPMAVDKDTELVSTAGLQGVLVYKYRLVNYAAEELDLVKFKGLIATQVRNSACTTSETRTGFLKKGVTLRYMYEDKVGTHLVTIEVKAEDCGF